MAKEFTADLQKLFLEFMMQDAQNFVRIQNIFNPNNFDRSIKDAAVFIGEHCDKFGAMPTYEQVKAATKITLKPVPELRDQHVDWFMEEFEMFTRRQELERAILKSADLLEKGTYDPVEKLIKDAVQISLTKDLGTNYFEDPRARLMALKDNNGQCSTGWPMLDKKLFGGINKGELGIFAGSSGAGKSLFLQNLAVNWITAGMNGVYITLELDEELTSMRIDSMLTSTSTKDIFRNLDDVEMKVKMYSKKYGNLQIKYLPAQSTVNDIRAYLKELEIVNNFKADFLLVDYLGLLKPVSANVSAENLYIKDKYVSEELRNLAKELNCIFMTAAQLNRCLSLDTKVIVNGEEVKIKDVNIGDWLESNNGPVEVLEKLPIIKQSVYKIKTKSGKEIICSAEHKFPVNGALRTINTGLKIGDNLRRKINNNSNAGEQNDNKQDEAQ